MTPQTSAMHAEYCRLTGYDLTLDYMKLQAWHTWQTYRKHEPFTLVDLQLVIRFLQSQIKAGERKKGCLKFWNLVESPDYFELDLQDARAWARAPRDTGRAKALREGGITPEPAGAPSRSAEQVLKEAAWVKQHLAEWRAKQT